MDGQMCSRSDVGFPRMMTDLVTGDLSPRKTGYGRTGVVIKTEFHRDPISNSWPRCAKFRCLRGMPALGAVRL